jgi:ribosomal protein S18 acetylase RimI-like enzyme
LALIVRLYEEADHDAVLRLWEGAGIERPWLDLGAEIDAMIRHDPSLFFVAVDGNDVVGAVMGGYDGRRGWMYHLAVEASIRRGGIGRQLVLALEEAMRNRGVAKINLQVRSGNEEVISFYERVGYVDEELTSMGKRLST